MYSSRVYLYELLAHFPNGIWLRPIRKRQALQPIKFVANAVNFQHAYSTCKFKNQNFCSRIACLNFACLSVDSAGCNIPPTGIDCVYESSRRHVCCFTRKCFSGFPPKSVPVMKPGGGVTAYKPCGKFPVVRQVSGWLTTEISMSELSRGI